jgi:hypothetical protein
MVRRDGSTISLLRGTDCSPARIALPAVLDSFSHVPHVKTLLVQYIARSRQAPPRRLNQLAPEIVSTSPEGLCLYCEYKNSLLVRLGRQREPRLPHGLMHAVQSSPQGFTCASAHSSAHHQPWFSFFVRRTEHFHLPLPRSEPCGMAEKRT